ncbi:MAG: hypothetical protein IAC78_01975 [Firmicutes bacterium]|uniref:Uncharacterized protein n=1 Tax=Candidatus Scatoplasma merdavium TaxID=2840932 RepID=A0A9D9GSL2_9BACL|nr:hypothetical protein [Candidatus Scatoplasma merdavium]
MFKMKEKLTKNHYKGFDHKMKILGITSLALLGVTSAVFVPLTAVYQNNIETAKLNEADKTNKTSQENYSLDYSDCQ